MNFAGSNSPPAAGLSSSRSLPATVDEASRRKSAVALETMSETKAVVFIPLTRGQVTVIDFDDFEKVRPFKWYARADGRRWYASRAVGPKSKRKLIDMHRFLCPTTSEDVAHIDGDGLNNQRENFQPCSHAQNLMGFQRKRASASSHFRGVTWKANANKWMAQIQVGDKNVYLGLSS